MKRKKNIYKNKDKQSPETGNFHYWKIYKRTDTEEKTSQGILLGLCKGVCGLFRVWKGMDSRYTRRWYFYTSAWLPGRTPLPLPSPTLPKLNAKCCTSEKRGLSSWTLSEVGFIEFPQCRIKWRQRTFCVDYHNAQRGQLSVNCINKFLAGILSPQFFLHTTIWSFIIL